ncbi:hypothetical protein PHET_11746, partial [Paragonimus heterotremus]
IGCRWDLFFSVYRIFGIRLWIILVAGIVDREFSLMSKMITQGYLILAEYNLVRAHHPPGIFVLPVADAPLIWTGIVSIRSGYYVGGIFRFRLILAPDFPSTQLPVSFQLSAIANCLDLFIVTYSQVGQENREFHFVFRTFLFQNFSGPEEPIYIPMHARVLDL